MATINNAMIKSTEKIIIRRLLSSNMCHLCNRTSTIVILNGLLRAYSHYNCTDCFCYYAIATTINCLLSKLINSSQRVVLQEEEIQQKQQKQLQQEQASQNLLVQMNDLRIYIAFWTESGAWRGFRDPLGDW